MTTDSAPPAVEVRGLTKAYGRRTVVDSVTFDVPAGAVSGLIGPNGAGKTTVMAMLLGLVRPTGGSAKVLGHPLGRTQTYLSRVGALIEAPAFHPGLAGRENLRHLARLGRHDTAEIPGLVRLVGLSGRDDDRYGHYSLGMKQRLGIAAALLGDPDLVVLDEPTNGVDPQGMRDIRAIVREIAREGRTVLVSSHLLGELEAVCDHLVVLDRGGCRYAGPLEELGADDGSLLVARSTAPAGDLARLLRAADIPASATDGRVEISCAGTDLVALAERANATAHAGGVVLTELRPTYQSLEEKVLELVGAPTADRETEGAAS